jgi:hypothetical protein
MVLVTEDMWMAGSDPLWKVADVATATWPGAEVPSSAATVETGWLTHVANAWLADNTAAAGAASGSGGNPRTEV